MPFTFAHPAIVLPLGYCSKRFISISALIIGSMTPDFEYFLRWKIKSIYSHTVWGIFWFDLPLGLLVWYLYFRYVHQVLIQQLPKLLHARLDQFSTYNWQERLRKHWWVIIGSLLLGAGSHLLWDSVTHHNGFVVLTFPILQQNLGSTQIPIFKLLQHFSTLGGMLVIGVAILRLSPKVLSSPITTKWYYWGPIFLYSVIILLARFWNWELPSIPIGTLVVSSISAISLSILFQSVLFYRS